MANEIKIALALTSWKYKIFLETICNIPDHSVAVEMLLEALIDEGIVATLDEIKGVGHRIPIGEICGNTSHR